jgi:Cu2+-exporting ATPase
VLGVLTDLAHRDATVLREGREVTVPASAVRAGDCVVVRAGQVVPVDGVVVDGRSAVDESGLTGEALPVEKVEGAAVYAGSISLDGRLVVRATRVGEESVLGRAAAAVRAAQARAGRWQQLADRVVRLFVPAVLVAGAGTFAWWRGPGGLGTEEALLRGIAVLVIACPCALAVATPLAVLAGAQGLGRMGVLLRSGEALERAAGVDTVLLDKTGTVTAGRLRLVDLCPVDEELLALAASVEAGSAHPLALAVVEAAEARGLPLRPVEALREVPGAGVCGRIAGQEVRVGRWGLEGPLPAELEAAVRQWEAQGYTPLALTVDGTCRAVLALGDWPRPEAAAAAVAELRRRGVEVRLVTGDAPGTAAAVSRAVGIPSWSARVLPADKAALVAALQAEGRRVAFIGDGVNDAPALAQADLGVALGSGADLAVEAGELVLLRPDLRALPAILDLARRTRAVIRSNLAWALAYNSLALPAAVAGYAHPLLAAGAMVLSSAFVLGNTLRLLGRSPWRLGRAALGVACLFALLGMLAWWGY